MGAKKMNRKKNVNSKSGKVFTSSEFHLQKFVHPFRSCSYTTSWQILMNSRGLLMSATRVMGKLWLPPPTWNGARRSQWIFLLDMFNFYCFITYLTKSWQSDFTFVNSTLFYCFIEINLINRNKFYKFTYIQGKAKVINFITFILFGSISHNFYTFVAQWL